MPFVFLISAAFEKPFTFFDTTMLLDNPEVLGAMADYLFFNYSFPFDIRLDLPYAA
jgi:hypothetical protein